MTRENVLMQLIDYISVEVLDGSTGEVNEDTPLLEWGVLNSLEVVNLVSFIRATFDKEIALDRLTPKTLHSPGTIADLVVAG